MKSIHNLFFRIKQSGKTISSLCLAVGVSITTLKAQDVSALKSKTDKTNRQMEQMLSSGSLAFEENKGQITGEDAHKARFMMQDGGAKIFLLNDRIAYQFEKTLGEQPSNRLPKSLKERLELKRNHLTANESLTIETYRMDAVLVNANLNTEVITEGIQRDVIHYYNHNAPNVHRYSKVTYKNVYPNIDWIIFTKNGSIEYEFALHPGGNPNDIKIRYEYTEELSLLNNGNLKIGNRLGSITEKAPISFQGKNTIATQYVLNANVLSFNIATYDTKQTLIIDPEVEWGTYYPHAGWSGQAVRANTDNEGNVYFVGSAFTSTGLASPGAHQTSYGGAFSDGYLIKFDAAGNRMYATYYGGSSGEGVQGCAADHNGNVFIVGYTSSLNNISTSGTHQANYGGGTSDIFLAKFNAAGIRQWGTYIGGDGYDDGMGCSVDTAGNVYVSGSTDSDTGIATPGTHMTTTDFSGDAFLMKFNNDGVRQWGTYFGGDGWDGAGGCSIAEDGSIYIVGFTDSENDLATTGAHQTIYGGGWGSGYLAKFTNAGMLNWATYYGGEEGDDIGAVSIDASGNVYVFGNAESLTGIATAGSHQDTHGGGWSNLFAAKFNSAGTRQWGTYYGGEEGEYCFMGDADAAGNVYLYGETYSLTGIATPGAIKETGDNINGDVLVAKLNTDGVRLWGTYYGGEETEYGYFCTTDKFGNFYFGGETHSDTGIATPGAYQDTYTPGSHHFFLVKLNTCSDYTIVTDTLVDSVAIGNTYTLNGQTYTPGIHIYDTLQNLAGCDSAILVLDLSSFNSIKKLQKITGKLYPNPTSQNLFFEFNNLIAGDIQYQITDITGRVVLKEEKVKVNNNNTISIDLKNINDGIYLFKLSTTSEEEQYVDKFIIVR